MVLKFVILYLVNSICKGKDYYFYTDVRWDDVDAYTNTGSNLIVPYDHGLRVLPALHVAKDKLEKLSLWSGAPKGEKVSPDDPNSKVSKEVIFYGAKLGRDIENHPYHTRELCRTWYDDCLYDSEYDIGVCGTGYNYPCLYTPKKDHVFAFNKNTTAHNWQIIEKSTDQIHLILPDGSGLPTQIKSDFNDRFNGSLPAKFTVTEMLERLRFIKDKLGADFSGIIGSTDQAYYTAFAAYYLGIPNIIAQVNSKDSQWPVYGGFNDRILDHSMVIGYEDWIIYDILTYIAYRTSWNTGTIEILHESGYSEDLATRIKANLIREMAERVSDTRMANDISLKLITKWDFYISESNRSTDTEVDDIISRLKDTTRVVTLMGKRDFIREMLYKFHNLKMGNRLQYPEKLAKDPDFGFIIIPENGAPCDNIWQSGDKYVDEKLKIILEGVFLICHNSHNRKTWEFKKPRLAPANCTDGESDECKNRYSCSCNEAGSTIADTFTYSPPSFNIHPSFSSNGRRETNTLIWDDEIDMDNWNNFTEEFGKKAKQLYNYNISSKEVSGIAGFAHDSLMWGMFTALLNVSRPGLFESPDGGFTLMNLYADMSISDNTLNEDQGETVKIGWPGMWGIDEPPLASKNVTHNYQSQRFLVNDGPWSDRYNRYLFKDNIPYNPVAHTIKIFQNGTWHRFAALNPHRRPFEQGKGLEYDKQFNLGAVKSLTTATRIERGLIKRTFKTMYEDFKFYRIWDGSLDFQIDASEPDCNYDNSRCKWEEFLNKSLPIIIAAAITLIIILAILIFVFTRRAKYSREVGAMKWKLNPDNIDFNISGKGLRSSMMGVTGTKAGTMGTMGTRGTLGTLGGDTMMSIGAGTAHLGTRGTMGTRGTLGTQYSIATFQTLGTNMTLGSEGGGRRKDQVFAQIAVHNAKRCAVKELDHECIALLNDRTFEFLQEMKELHDINHENVVNFHGTCLQDGEHLMYLTDYCLRGSLQDVLEDSESVLDLSFKISFIVDIIRGMDYIHSSKHLRSHGYLKTSNCVVTSFFTVKISDFGALQRRRDTNKIKEMERIPQAIRLLCTAPEILRNPDLYMEKGTKEGDVYSFGIICHEILENCGPFNTSDEGCDYSATDILRMVKNPHGRTHRPAFSGIATDVHEQTGREIAIQCWNEDTTQRPTFKHLLHSAIPKLKDEKLSLIQSILSKIQTYVRSKEKQNRETEREIISHARAYKELQKQLLPQHIMDKVTMGMEIKPEWFEGSILNFELLGCERFAKKCGSDIWEVFSNLKSAVASFLESHDDLYCVCDTVQNMIVVANSGGGCKANHATSLFTLVNEISMYMDTMLIYPDGMSSSILKYRASINSGKIYSAVVADKFKKFQVYGTVVDIAEKIRRFATEGSCTVTEDTKLLLLESKTPTYFTDTPSHPDFPRVKLFVVSSEARK